MSWCNNYEGEDCFLCKEPTEYKEMDFVLGEWVCNECIVDNETEGLNTQQLVYNEQERRRVEKERRLIQVRQLNIAELQTLVKNNCKPILTH